MRKFITYILLLAMVCSLVGCGGRSNESTPTEPSYSMQDLLLKQATDLAQQVSLAVSEKFLLSAGLPENTAAIANVFASASDPSNIVSAALLRVDRVDLPNTITDINKNAISKEQNACVSALQLSTRFYSEQPLSGGIGIFLQYSSDCFFVVLFEGGDHQLIQATVYPLFTECATMLMNKYFPTASRISQGTVLTARDNAADTNCKATPVEGSVNASFYLTMAEYMLAHSSALTAKELYQYTPNNEVRTQVIQYSKVICGERKQGAVFQFPADLENAGNGFTSTQVKNWARQNAYLGWIDALSAEYGSQCLSANSILNDAMFINVPRSVVDSQEAPVLIVLDFGNYTGIITVYPNEYNTYLYTVTCLPCTFASATTMLTQRGAVKL